MINAVSTEQGNKSCTCNH